MSSEKKYQSKVILGMAVVVFCATAYAWGGMEMKWLRRFLAPFSASVFLAIINKDPLQLVKAPLLGIASSLGYGAETISWKITKRLYVGLAFSIGATITDIVRKKWLVVGFSTVLITSAFIIYGVWNPVHARVEESILGFLIYGMAIIPSIKE
jgi:hypothetical protein